jgi:hypothetical protein
MESILALHCNFQSIHRTLISAHRFMYAHSEEGSASQQLFPSSLWRSFLFAVDKLRANKGGIQQQLHPAQQSLSTT